MDAVRPIRTRRDYQSAMKTIERLWGARPERGPPGAEPARRDLTLTGTDCGQTPGCRTEAFAPADRSTNIARAPAEMCSDLTCDDRQRPSPETPLAVVEAHELVFAPDDRRWRKWIAGVQH